VGLGVTTNLYWWKMKYTTKLTDGIERDKIRRQCMRGGDGHYQGQMLVVTITPKFKVGYNDGRKYKAI
jgi:hypothetical protein